MTKLEAINSMLRAVGARPVTTVEGTLPFDAAQALATLTHAVKTFQSSPHWFNTVRGDHSAVSGKIAQPANAVGVESPYADERLSWRDGYLYDDNTGTDDEFSTKTLIVWYAYDFDNIPPVAQDYLAAAAKYAFASELLADRALVSLVGQQVSSALVAYSAAELEHSGFNIFNHDGGSSFQVGIRPRHSRRAW